MREGAVNPLGGDDDPAVALRGRQVQDRSQGIDGPVELIVVETDHRQIAAGPGLVPERPNGASGLLNAATACSAAAPVAVPVAPW
ncbi:hypothetical protein ACWF2L_04980 [Streptomyces anulatus]